MTPEPWIPKVNGEPITALLKVGTRVRVRLSGECPGKHTADGYLILHCGPSWGEHGTVGVIDNIDAEAFPDHPYRVQLFKQMPPWFDGFPQMFYAATELDLLV